MEADKITTNEVFLTRKEVAEKLKVTYPTLKRWRDKGLLTAVKVGGTVRYTQSQVESTLKGKS